MGGADENAADVLLYLLTELSVFIADAYGKPIVKAAEVVVISLLKGGCEMLTSNTIKIAVCDSGEADRAKISNIVADYLDRKDYNVRLLEFSSADELLSSDVSQLSLVIMETLFPDGIDGIEAAKQLMLRNPRTRVVFCSATDKYAVESYDVSALHYFLKPLPHGRLEKVLDRFFMVHTMLRTLSYNRNRINESIYLTDILWIEADKHHSIIHTRKGDIETSTRFSHLCSQLDGTDFVKPIRYAMVPLGCVALIPTDVFTLIDGTTVRISRNLRAEMRQRFEEYKMRTSGYLDGR